MYKIRKNSFSFVRNDILIYDDLEKYKIKQTGGYDIPAAIIYKYLNDTTSKIACINKGFLNKWLFLSYEVEKIDYVDIDNNISELIVKNGSMQYHDLIDKMKFTRKQKLNKEYGQRVMANIYPKSLFYDADSIFTDRHYYKNGIIKWHFKSNDLLRNHNFIFKIIEDRFPFILNYHINYYYYSKIQNKVCKTKKSCFVSLSFNNFDIIINNDQKKVYMIMSIY